MHSGTKSYETVVSKLRSARSDYFRALKPSNKSFWKAVSSLNRGNSSIPTLVSEVGEEASTPASKAALLNDQFVKKFNFNFALIQGGLTKASSSLQRRFTLLF